MFLRRASELATAARSDNIQPRGVRQSIDGQWINPSDIFSILLIIGGNILQKAIAQLAGSLFVPVAFSFGWVAYSFEALMSAVGDNSLMPEPDCSVIVINAKNGMSRSNKSWVLGRIVRDFDKAIHGSLRVSVYEPGEAGQLSIDYIWISGVVTILVQFGISLIPWILHQNWAIFIVTAGSTLLALINCALPQWKMEKWACRRNTKGKKFCLTRGNGSRHVMVVLGNEAGYDLEDMAGGRHGEHPYTRIATAVLAFLWIVILMTVIGIKQDSWYILAVGSIGMIQNVVAAGAPRDPSAYGIPLKLVREIEDRKVMKTLQDTEDEFPTVGACLVKVFFPGGLRPDEQEWWAKKAELSEKQVVENPPPPSLIHMPGDIN